MTAPALPAIAPALPAASVAVAAAGGELPEAIAAAFSLLMEGAALPAGGAAPEPRAEPGPAPEAPGDEAVAVLLPGPPALALPTPALEVPAPPLSSDAAPAPADAPLRALPPPRGGTEPKVAPGEHPPMPAMPDLPAAALAAARAVAAAPPFAAAEMLPPQDAPDPGAALVASLAPQQLAMPARAEPAPPPPVTVPLHDPRWADQVAERVVWSARNELGEAEIHLHPPELGPLRVHLRLENGDVSVQFSAPHAQTREALEASLPKLRELFEQQGLALVQAQVSDHRHAPRQEPGFSDAPRGAGEPVEDVAVTRLRPRGLLDEYA